MILILYLEMDVIKCYVGCDRLKSKSRVDLLKALDAHVEDKDILGYDYLPAQTLAMNEQVENRLFKRVGRTSHGKKLVTILGNVGLQIWMTNFFSLR